MFPQGQKISVEDNKLKELTDATTFCACIKYAMRRAGLGENKLAALTGITQSKIHLCIHEKLHSLSSADLLKICLVLKLNKTETIFLMASAERAFCPWNQEVCFELIDIYATSDKNYADYKAVPEQFLDQAKLFLRERGKESLLY